MIWLTWRQFRTQALAAAGVLTVTAAFLVVLGLRIRTSYDTFVACGAGCDAASGRELMETRYLTVLLLTGFAILLAPVLIGAFWGAPLIARELETGTHRLVWNQSVPRTRWLAVKLAGVTLAAAATTGVLSALLTWAASPYDAVTGNRFDALQFGVRGLAPVGYAVFAIVLGTTAGLLLRRTVPAMAVTLAAFAVLQIVMPTLVRPHLLTPVTRTLRFDQHAFAGDGRLNTKDVGHVERFEIPGAWVFTSRVPLLDGEGRPISEERLRSCATFDDAKDAACIARMDAHFTVSYQPADRYWTFQWLELAVYLALAGLLAAFAFHRISKGIDR